MKYSLSWTEPAEKMLGKLPDSIAHRIYNKVEAIDIHQQTIPSTISIMRVECKKTIRMPFFLHNG
jgi:mRNA-degrading endonuclease RelE of RelBE toxin-antitoxin system